MPTVRDMVDAGAVTAHADAQEIHRTALALFSDTISGRMLRRLCLATCMPQADFMADYMRRCDRKLTRYAKPGQTKPNPSSFTNNFGRFVHGGSSSSLTRSGRHKAPRCIRQDRLSKGRNLLVWTGLTGGDLISRMTDVDLERFSVALEAQMLEPRPTDSDERHESAPWLTAIRAEITRRATFHCQNQSTAASHAA